MKKRFVLQQLKPNGSKMVGFKNAYDALELEYQLALELIKARAAAGLSQAEVDHRMGTTQSAIARLEAGRKFPSMKTLFKYTQATGQHLHISFSH
jgi:DNA-binding XRE family transcriptional regulator